MTADTRDIVLALITAAPPTIVAISALIVSIGNRSRLNSLHLEINSRLSQLLRATARAAHRDGAAGRRWDDDHNEGVSVEGGKH